MYYTKNLISGILTLAIMLFVSTGLIQAQNTNQNQNNNNTEDDVVDVIQESDEHSIFASLLEETGKLQELRNKKDVTIIAPTDEAFEQMNTDVEELKNNPRELENLIENHIMTNGEKSRNMDNWDTRVRHDNRGNQVGVGGDDQVDALNRKNKEVIEASNGKVVIVDKVLTDKNKDKMKDKHNKNEDWEQ